MGRMVLKFCYGGLEPSGTNRKVASGGAATLVWKTLEEKERLPRNSLAASIKLCCSAVKPHGRYSVWDLKISISGRGIWENVSGEFQSNSERFEHHVTCKRLVQVYI